MIVSMDLNASPVPDEDEETFERHEEVYSAPEEHIETAVSIARREREERKRRLKRDRSIERPVHEYQQPARDQFYPAKNHKSDRSRLPPGDVLNFQISWFSFFSVEWSVEEQFKLEEGLVRFADEPSILRYIKIAATLRDKTVRDVALRCRWMTRKRRKPEEHIGKKVNNRKDKLVPVESSLKINNTPSAPGPSMAAYSHMMMHHMNRKEHAPSEASEISSAAAHLLEQNAQAFTQITANLSMYKLQDNIDLFRRTRNNIIAILNDMRDTPGIMSKMLPLPVSINEDLANRILPSTT